MHNVFDIKRNFHGWHSTPTDNLAAIFFCSARRYRLSFKQRYQPTNKKKWFFHIPRQAMSTPNDLCLFALRHWMSSAHFFFVVVHLYFSSLVPHIHSTAILLVHWKFVVAVCWRDPAQPATAETPFCRCCCFLMLQKRTHLFYYYILHGRQSNITIINFKKIMQIEFHSDCNQVKCSIIYMLFFTSYSVCVARHTVVIHNTHRQLAQT